MPAKRTFITALFSTLEMGTPIAQLCLLGIIETLNRGEITCDTPNPADA